MEFRLLASAWLNPNYGSHLENKPADASSLSLSPFSPPFLPPFHTLSLSIALLFKYIF